jgi:arabinan endo-1,5-alpha-L-arabinosidase
MENMEPMSGERECVEEPLESREEIGPWREESIVSARVRFFLAVGAIAMALFALLDLRAATNGPPVLLPVTGNITPAASPHIIKEGAWYYLFSHGSKNISMRRSPDLTNWALLGTVFPPYPSWHATEMANYDAIWAPSVHAMNGLFYMYYSVYCTSNSHVTGVGAVGLMTNKTLDPASPSYRWGPVGMVAKDTHSSTNYLRGAIDPNLFHDPAGNPWLTYGSLYPIRIRPIDPISGLIGDSNRIAVISSRSMQEASHIFRRGAYYYLITANGTYYSDNYTEYVARATAFDGPYYDKAGLAAMSGGGTAFSRGPYSNQYHCIAHGSVFSENGQDYWVVNYYTNTGSGKTGSRRLAISTIQWDPEGWPTTVFDLPYYLTVSNGSGSGAYRPHVPVTITAKAAPAGMVFDAWVTNNNGNPIISNRHASTTTVMINNAWASISATYRSNTNLGAPAVSGIPSSFATNRAFTIRAVVDRDFGYLSTNSLTGPYAAFTTNGTSLTVDKTMTLWYFGRDSLGNTSLTNRSTYTITLDLAPPVTHVAPTSLTTNRAFSVTLGVDKNFGYWSANGTNFLPFTVSGTNLTIGATTTLWHYGYTNGAQGPTNSATYTFDTTAPSIAKLPSNIITNTSFALRFDINENNGYLSSIGPAGPYGAFFTNGTNLLVSKSTTFWYFGRDALGNASKTNTTVCQILPQAVAANDLSGIRVVGSPYRGQGPGISFHHLTSNASVQVYSISGRFVGSAKRDPGMGPGTLLWPALQADGIAVPPGIYLCVVADGSDARKIVKVMVSP